MKNFLKLILGATVFLFPLFTAHAAIFQGTTVITTSTISSAGAVLTANNGSDFTSTSTALTNLGAVGLNSANNYTGVNNFTATTTIAQINATGTNNSFVARLNGSVYLPDQDFLNTYGCPGFPSDAHVDDCANDWYNYFNGKVSSTVFSTPVYGGNYTWSDNHGFQFTNGGETATLNCASGRGTNFKSTAATGTMLAMAWGTGSNPGAGTSGCSWIGTVTNQTASISAGLTGILLGSSTVAHGLTGAVIRATLVSGTSAAVNFSDNAYNTTIEDSWLQNSGYNLYDPSQSNGGESNRAVNSFIVSSANASTSNCIDIAATSFVLNNVSHDACQLTVENGGHVVSIAGHAETTQTGTYGAYSPVHVKSGGVLDEYGKTYVLDGTGTNVPAQYILADAGASGSENGAVVQGNPSSTAFIGGAGAGGFTIHDLHNIGGIPTSSLTLNNVPSEAGLTGTASGTLIYDTTHNLLSTGDANTSGTISKTLFFQANFPWIAGGSVASDTLISAQASNTESVYTTTYTIPANFLAANKTIKVDAGWQDMVPANLTSKTMRLEGKLGSGATTTLAVSATSSAACTNNNTCSYGVSLYITALTAPSSNASVTVTCVTANGGSPSTVLWGRCNTVQPVSLNTATSVILQWSSLWNNNGNPTTSSFDLFRIEDVN